MCFFQGHNIHCSSWISSILYRAATTHKNPQKNCPHQESEADRPLHFQQVKSPPICFFKYPLIRNKQELCKSKIRVQSKWEFVGFFMLKRERSAFNYSWRSNFLGFCAYEKNKILFVFSFICCWIYSHVFICYNGYIYQSIISCLLSYAQHYLMKEAFGDFLKLNE